MPESSGALSNRVPLPAVTNQDKSITGQRTVAASGDRIVQPGPDAPPERLRWWRRHPGPDPTAVEEPTPMSPTAFPRLDRRKLRALLEPVVEGAGAELEDVTEQRAGSRRLIRVV